MPKQSLAGKSVWALATVSKTRLVDITIYIREAHGKTWTPYEAEHFHDLSDAIKWADTFRKSAFSVVDLATVVMSLE